jgi:hypothetical protein
MNNKYFILIAFCILLSINICAQKDNSFLPNYKNIFIDSLIQDYKVSFNLYTDSVLRSYSQLPDSSDYSYKRHLYLIILFEKDTLLNIDNFILQEIDKFPNLVPNNYYINNERGAIIFYNSNKPCLQDSTWIEKYVKSFNLYSPNNFTTCHTPIFEYHIKNNKVISKKLAFNNFSIQSSKLKQTHQPLTFQFNDY